MKRTLAFALATVALALSACSNMGMQGRMSASADSMAQTRIVGGPAMPSSTGMMDDASRTK